MFCPKCGARVQENSKFCNSCGERMPEKGTPLTAANAVHASAVKEEADIRRFKKSGFGKWLIVLAIISGILGLIAYLCNSIFSAITAIAMMALFITVRLIGSGVIKRAKILIRVLLTIVAFALIIPYFYFFDASDKIVWSEIILGDAIPQPNSERGEIKINNENGLSLILNGIDRDEYDNYLKECQSHGFICEAQSEKNDYFAYNTQGYEIELHYDETEEELSLTLDKPLYMGTFEWSTNELANLIPKPESNIGMITNDTSEKFSVYVGEIPRAEYNAYVKLCENAGFNLNFTKTEDRYSAKNVEGYELDIAYIGCYTISIDISIPRLKDEELSEAEDESKSGTESEFEETSEVSKDEGTDTLIDPDFKKAMDSYEAFYDEYIDVVKKYTSNPLDYMDEYFELIEKEIEMAERFEKIGEDELNDAELAYYLEVQTRVTKKLSEIAS